MLKLKGMGISFVVGCLVLAGLLLLNGLELIDIDFRLRGNRYLLGLPLVTTICLPVIYSAWAMFFRHLFAPRRRYQGARANPLPEVNPFDPVEGPGSGDGTERAASVPEQSAPAAEASRDARPPDGGSNWAQLAPNLREEETLLADLARQVRILLASGKERPEILDWLQIEGLSAEEAQFLLEDCEQAPTLEVHWEYEGVLPLYLPDDFLAKRKERQKKRQEKSQRLAESEPDPAFDTTGTSYGQVLVREFQRNRGRTLFCTLLAFAAVFGSILFIAVAIVRVALR
jgi:hypothetical protein